MLECQDRQSAFADDRVIPWVCVLQTSCVNPTSDTSGLQPAISNPCPDTSAGQGLVGTKVCCDKPLLTLLLEDCEAGQHAEEAGIPGCLHSQEPSTAPLFYLAAKKASGPSEIDHSSAQNNMGKVLE